MSTILVLTFPNGHYHANPWGRHVNEGAVELPPSPWRLLRALYAVWRTRVPGLDETTVHELLTRLAEPPTAHVPRHGVAHTRHYYPDSTHRTGKTSTDRTLDAFAVFERDADLTVSWPFDLPPEQHETLQRLAASLPYFGRADSICTASVPSEWTATGHDTWVPVDVADDLPREAVVTAVLAPELPLRPEALVARPVDVRRGGLLFPAGTRFVGYQRVAEAAPVRQRRHRIARRPAAVRLSVLQAGLPPETDALVHTDTLRQAALSRLGRLPGERDRTMLGGKQPDGTAMERHQHAHYLPLTRDRRLTGLLVWTPGGLPDDELKALTDLRRLYRPATEGSLNLRVAGVGPVNDVAPELVGPATIWRSATPFTPSRYPKRRQDWLAFLAGEVGRELAVRGTPAPVAVEAVDEGWTSWIRFRPSRRLSRDRRQGQASLPSAFLRLRFAEEVTGPLSLGHLSHFGLGLFVPDGT